MWKANFFQKPLKHDFMGKRSKHLALKKILEKKSKLLPYFEIYFKKEYQKLHRNAFLITKKT